MLFSSEKKIAFVESTEQLSSFAVLPVSFLNYAWILWGCCFCQQIFMLRTEKSKKVNVTPDRIEWARERYLFWISSPVWETATQDVAAAGHHSDTPVIFNSSMISSVILLRADRSITGLCVVGIGQTRTVSHLLLALRQSMVIFLRFVFFSESVGGTPVSRAVGSDGSAVSLNQVPCHSDIDMKTHQLLKSASQSG